MASFYQPRPRPGFVIDTSSSMHNTQLARAVAELGGLTRQLGYGAEVVVACCDAAVHDVRKVFTAAQLQMYGGGGTDIGVGLRFFIEKKSTPVDFLVVVTDCHTPWPEDAPPFPVITIRVGDGLPPPWADRRGNKVITIDEPSAFQPKRTHVGKEPDILKAGIRTISQFFDRPSRCLSRAERGQDDTAASEAEPPRSVSRRSEAEPR